MKSCKFIDGTIVFTSSRISPCYSCYSSDAPVYTAELNYNFQQQKEIMTEKINSDNYQNYPCKTCCNYMDFEKLNYGFNLIILKFWNNESPNYNLINIIENLYEQNLINTENLVVEFQSDNISIFHTSIIKLLETRGYKKINLVIKNPKSYNPLLESILAEGKSTLTVLLDYSDKTILNDFKMIARNLKYYLANMKDKNAMKVYYTLTLGENDNKKDIHNFIFSMYKTGLNVIGLRLEQKMIQSSLKEPLPLKNLPGNLDRMILYFFKLAKKYTFSLDMDYEEQNIVLKKIFKTNKRAKIINKVQYFFDKLMNRGL